MPVFGRCGTLRRGEASRAATPRAPKTSATAVRRGLTLVELLVSLGVVGVLMTALGSVMVLTGKAVTLSAAQAEEAKVDDAVATLAGEQRLALRVLERTSTAVTFVTDRDRDGVTETVRYAWSGVPGDPLTRQVNGGVPVVVVRDVRRFNLTYLLRSTAAAPAPPPDVEVGSDVLLYAHTSGSGAAAVSTTSWVAQYFKPDWAAVAPGKTVTGWRVTRVEVVASKAVGSTGVTPWVVRLYSASGTTPNLLDKRDETTLGVTTMATTSSPGAYFSSGTMGSNSGLASDKGMCITVGPQAFSPSGFVGFDNASADAAGAMSLSSNSGVTWGAASPTRDVRIRVWGRYKYPGP